jgi:hypothetical protein
VNLIFALTLALTPAVVQSGSPTIEQLVERYSVETKIAEDAKRQAEATREEIRRRYKELTDKLAPLGIFPPGPGPVVPPKPEPPTPDALAKRLKEAFDADNGKSADAKALAALYSLCVKLCADEGLASSADLLTRLRVASANMVAPGVLGKLRMVVSGELIAIFAAPSDDPLTKEQRDAAAALFARLATILEGF